MNRTEFMKRVSALPFLGFLAPAEEATTLYTGRGGDGLDYGIPDEHRHQLDEWAKGDIIDTSWNDPSGDIKVDMAKITKQLDNGRYRAKRL